MLTFIGGPADRAAIPAFTAPEFVRVCQIKPGTWDLIEAGESLPTNALRAWVYRRYTNGTPREYRDKNVRQRRRNGWYAIASYLFVADQPAYVTAASAELFRAWCMSELVDSAPALRALVEKGGGNNGN